MFGHWDWRRVALAGAGLLLAAADAPRDTRQPEAHAQRVVAAQLYDMGAEGVEFSALHAIPLPRADGPPGLAVCGRAEDVDGDLAGNPWALNFIAFYEWVDGTDGDDDWAAPIGEPLFLRAGEPHGPTPGALCAAAADTARRRLPPAAQPVAGVGP